MIHYNSLWETMSNKHFTTYTLREKHNNCVFTIAVGTAGNFGFPAGALFL